MMKNKLEKYGKSGRMPARSLFEDGTYKLEDFHDAYIECEDMTEYKPAMKMVGTWKEWCRLKRDWPTFNSYLAEWREELEIKLRSRAMEKLQGLVAEGNLQAAKFFAEEGYNKKKGAGRPGKSERDQAAKELAKAAAETAQDRERILKVINGGRSD